MEHPPRRDTTRNVCYKRRVKWLKAKLHVSDESRRLSEVGIDESKFTGPRYGANPLGNETAD
jgi:hypothetical protein